MHSPKETKRLSALRAAQLLDTPPDEAFDRLTRLAATTIRAPLAFISLIDDCRQFLKSRYPHPAAPRDERQSSLRYSFCKHVVVTSQALIVPDARIHPLLSDNPAVAEFNIIAYAGVPLIDSFGNCYGSLCAVDHQQRTWTDREVAVLRAIAAQIVTEIELRSLSDARTPESQTTGDLSAADRGYHTLRAPLNSLLAGLDVFNTTPPADHTEWIALLRRSANAMRVLLDDTVGSETLKERGAGALTLESVDPSVLLRAVIFESRVVAAKRGLLFVAHTRNLPESLQGDTQKLKRALLSLAEQAVRVTAPGGQVELNASATDSSLVIEILANGAPLQREASDDPGATELRGTIATSPEIFTFCAEVMSVHGGTLTAERVRDTTNVFKITLPFRSAPKVQAG